MATLDRIGGAEPSTLTFKLRTVRFNQNSSNMMSEVMVLGDPDSTNAIAAVLASAPASTAWGIVTREVGSRFNIGSTAADNAVSAAQAGTWTVNIQGNSTAVQAAGSTWNVRAQNSSAADLQATVTPAAGSTWTVRALNSSAADLQATVTPLAGSTFNVRALCSSAADFQVTATQAGTWTFNLGTGLQSTSAPSSNSSGVIVRQVVDIILTTASTNAFSPSTALVIQSSGAGLRSYVTAYSITSTVQAITKVAFYSSANMLWPVALAALSSAFAGVNLAVGAPAYLFRSGNQEALTLNTGNSTIAGFKVGVSYFRAP